ncbi:hypothetical protein ACIBO1_09830 [Micromonospora sp. NPDC049903]|uniref:hypothetical protein n=1 Tax=Micromonospora sp. NPDC049903 TaxID=3364276 RepID=UPI0037B3CF76
MATTEAQNAVARAPEGGKGQIKAAVIAAIGTVLASVVTASAGLLGGWLDWTGPGSTSRQSEIPDRIVTPVDGEAVAKCTPVRGIAPLGDKASTLWLVVHPLSEDRNYYLSRRITLLDSEAPAWDLGSIVIGGDSPAGESSKFELILIRAERDLGEYLSGFAGKPLGVILPPDAEEVHKIIVVRNELSGC